MADPVPHRVQLPEVLDLRAAGPLHAMLLAARGQAVEVDASEVQRFGAQCLQVLLAARASWNFDGEAFRVKNPSGAFTDGLALFGAAPFEDA